MRNCGLSEVFEFPPATLPVDSSSMTWSYLCTILERKRAHL